MASPTDTASTPRKWTQAEDRRLQVECEQQLREAGAVNDWMAVAEKIPHRTNKDCRKRWSKICATLRKGPWSADEDTRLRQGVAQHGSKWTLVAGIVNTRSADQCAKRWQHSLDPQLDRSEWKPEEDRLLLEAVRQYGQSWTTIAQAKFPRRSKTDIKNRYSIILRRLRQRPSYLPLPSETTEDDEDDDWDSDFELEDSNQPGISHHLRSPSSQHSFSAVPHNYSMSDMTRNVPPYLSHDYRTSSGSSGSSASSAASPFTPPTWEPNNDFMNQPISGNRMVSSSRSNSEMLSPTGTPGLMSPMAAMNMDGATNMTEEEFMNCMDGLEGYMDISGGPSTSGYHTPSTLTITIEDADPHHIDGITSMLLRSKSKFRMQQS